MNLYLYLYSSGPVTALNVPERESYSVTNVNSFGQAEVTVAILFLIEVLYSDLAFLSLVMCDCILQL